MGKLCVSSLEMMDVFLVSNGHAISGGSVLLLLEHTTFILGRNWNDLLPRWVHNALYKVQCHDAGENV